MLKIPKIVCTYFFVLSLSWALLIAFHDYWGAYFLLWPILAMTFVLSAYWFNNPAMLGKNPHIGILNKGFVVFLFPFFALVWGCWWFQNKKSKEPCYSRIMEGVYLGRYTRDLESLPARTNCMVVDMTCEFSEPESIRVCTQYRCFPVLDGHYPGNMEDYLDLIEEIHRWAGPVCIHCAQGHGRSGALAAILVILKGHAITVDEAVAYLKEIRPGVNLSQGQRKVVEKALEMWKEKHQTLFC